MSILKTVWCFRVAVMCPLYPLHVVLLYLCLALPLLLAVVDGADSLAAWRLTFSRNSIGHNKTERLRELTTGQFDVLCSDCDQDPGAEYKLRLRNEDPGIAFLQQGDNQQVLTLCQTNLV